MISSRSRSEGIISMSHLAYTKGIQPNKRWKTPWQHVCLLSWKEKDGADREGVEVKKDTRQKKGARKPPQFENGSISPKRAMGDSSSFCYRLWEGISHTPPWGGMTNVLACDENFDHIVYMESSVSIPLLLEFWRLSQPQCCWNTNYKSLQWHLLVSQFSSFTLKCLKYKSKTNSGQSYEFCSETQLLFQLHRKPTENHEQCLQLIFPRMQQANHKQRQFHFSDRCKDRVG